MVPQARSRAGEARQGHSCGSGVARAVAARRPRSQPTGLPRSVRDVLSQRWVQTERVYDRSNVSYNVKKMVKNKYLAHERSVHDRRSIHVRLTEKGIKLRDGLTVMSTVVVAVAVPQNDGVWKRSQARPAPRIIGGRPWSTMPVSTCRWKVRASAFWMRQGGSCARPRVASEPEVLIAWFRGLGLAVARVGLEAGPLSQWLYVGIREAGLTVELLETRHVRDAFKAMPVKTDRNDARGIAQLMRLGWFRPMPLKRPSRSARELAPVGWL